MYAPGFTDPENGPTHVVGQPTFIVAIGAAKPLVTLIGNPPQAGTT